MEETNPDYEENSEYRQWVQKVLLCDQTEVIRVLSLKQAITGDDYKGLWKSPKGEHWKPPTYWFLVNPIYGKFFYGFGKQQPSIGKWQQVWVGSRTNLQLVYLDKYTMNAYKAFKSENP